MKRKASIPANLRCKEMCSGSSTPTAHSPSGKPNSQVTHVSPAASGRASSNEEPKRLKQKKRQRSSVFKRGAVSETNNAAAAWKSHRPASYRNPPPLPPLQEPYQAHPVSPTVSQDPGCRSPMETFSCGLRDSFSGEPGSEMRSRPLSSAPEAIERQHRVSKMIWYYNNMREPSCSQSPSAVDHTIAFSPTGAANSNRLLDLSMVDRSSEDRPAVSPAASVCNSFSVDGHPVDGLSRPSHCTSARGVTESGVSIFVGKDYFVIRRHGAERDSMRPGRVVDIEVENDNSIFVVLQMYNYTAPETPEPACVSTLNSISAILQVPRLVLTEELLRVSLPTSISNEASTEFTICLGISPLILTERSLPNMLFLSNKDSPLASPISANDNYSPIHENPQIHSMPQMQEHSLLDSISLNERSQGEEMRIRENTFIEITSSEERDVGSKNSSSD